MKTYGEWKYSSTVLELDTRWRRLNSDILFLYLLIGGRVLALPKRTLLKEEEGHTDLECPTPARTTSISSH
jgi:hypothetical protein